MRHASPHQVADVQQPVHPAQVHKYAVVRDVFHFAGNDSAFGQRAHQRVALGFLVFFQDRATAHHHVAALAIQFQHADFDFFFFPRIQIVHRTQFDLRSRQERAHADIHHQAALDPLGNLSLDSGVLAIGFLDAFPHAAAMCAHVRQQHVSVFLRVQPLHFDRLPRSKFNWAAGIHEFLRGNESFELPADVHDHARVRNSEHVAIENFALGCGGLRHGELLHELIHRLRCLGVSEDSPDRGRSPRREWQGL